MGEAKYAEPDAVGIIPPAREGEDAVGGQQPLGDFADLRRDENAVRLPCAPAHPEGETKFAALIT